MARDKYASMMRETGIISVRSVQLHTTTQRPCGVASCRRLFLSRNFVIDVWSVGGRYDMHFFLKIRVCISSLGKHTAGDTNTCTYGKDTGTITRTKLRERPKQNEIYIYAPRSSANLLRSPLSPPATAASSTGPLAATAHASTASSAASSSVA